MRTVADLAILHTGDGLTTLAIELDGELGKTAMPTATTAADQLSGVIKGLISRAGKAIDAGQIRGVRVTIQLADQQPSLEQLANKMLNPRAE